MLDPFFFLVITSSGGIFKTMARDADGCKKKTSKNVYSGGTTAVLTGGSLFHIVLRRSNFYCLVEL